PTAAPVRRPHQRSAGGARAAAVNAKKPGCPGFFTAAERRSVVDALDVRCLLALGAGDDVERNLLVLGQRLEAVALNRGEVSEDVFAAVSRGDEAEALGVVEPLDSTLCHEMHSLQ